MTKRTGPTNIIIRKLSDSYMKLYRKTGSGLWRDVAEHLLKPTRKRVAVNLSKINRFAEEGKIILVPGKVLGSGNLDKKVTVAALSFSEKALYKIKNAGGEAITLGELVEKDVKASDVKIIV